MYISITTVGCIVQYVTLGAAVWAWLFGRHHLGAHRLGAGTFRCCAAL